MSKRDYNYANVFTTLKVHQRLDDEGQVREARIITYLSTCDIELDGLPYDLASTRVQ